MFGHQPLTIRLLALGAETAVAAGASAAATSPERFAGIAGQSGAAPGAAHATVPADAAPAARAAITAVALCFRHQPRCRKELMICCPRKLSTSAASNTLAADEESITPQPIPPRP